MIVKSQDDYNPEVSIKKTPSKEWELDVRALISSKKWLQNYGLHKNKLAMEQILPAIGFKMSEGKINWISFKDFFLYTGNDAINGSLLDER